MDEKLFEKGTEIYMKCLISLQQQNSPNVMPLNPSNVPYPMANYSHFDQLSYMQNQLSPLAHAPQFNAVPYRHSYSWPRNHLFSFNSCEELSSIKNDYYHEYDRSRGYYDVPFVAMPHLAANPTNFTISSMSMQHYAPEQAQHSQFNFNQSAPATNPNGSQGDFQSRSNAPQQRPTAASSDKTKPKTPLGAPQSATKKNGKAQSANKKKIPRPMNSFMIYAKRHRAQVHLAHPKCDNRKVSKILSETWYAMDAEKKQKYHDLSVEMRREHYRMFPDFKWRSEVPTTPTDFKEVRSPKELPSQAKKPPSNANEGSLNTENVQNNVWTHSPSLPITPTSTENSLSPLYFGASIPISHEPIVPNVQPEFCLGPTPAQLGLKRKNKKSKPADLKIQNPSTNAGAASNATTDNPDLPFVSNNPHFKQLFTELPVFDFSTYRTEQEWNASPSPPSMTYNTNSRKRASTKQPAHLPNKRLVGERFFGPDFNLNHFEDLNETSTNASPVTPSSPDQHLADPQQQKEFLDKKKRQMIHQRKQLILGLFQKYGYFPATKDIDDFMKAHIQLFRTRSFLNAKIREIRQSHMHNGPLTH